MSDNYTSQINAAFEALKYNPHATQQLLQQQQKNPGGAQGPETLAAAAAANYQKSMHTPPPQQPPQQTVVAGLTQQPQMPMGLEAPNLEDFAQQQQQQRMATGGIVALAHGGPVQGYAEGGYSDIPMAKISPHETSWGPSWTLNDLLKFDATPSQSEQDYYKTTEPSPSKRRELNATKLDRNASQTTDQTETRSPLDYLSLIDGIKYPHSSSNAYPHSDPLDTTADILKTSAAPTMPPGGQTISTSEPQQPRPKQELEAPKKADGSPLSYEDQISYVQKVLGVPPDVSAEIKGQLEKRMAHEGNVNLIKDIAAGLGGFLGTRGYGQERVGAGIMNALQSSAIHGKEESDMQDKIDALHLKSMMLPYESRHQAGTLVLQSQQKLREAQAAAAAKRAELSYERGTKFGTEQIQGEFGLQREGLQNKSQMEIAQMKADADLKLEAAKTAIANNSLTGTNKTAVYNHLSELAGMGLIDRAKLDEAFQQSIATITGRSAPQAPAQQLGNGLSLSGTPTTP